MRYRCRVPGKAVLMGEYAVTDGLPAYALAVDRFAEVSLSACSNDQAGLRAPQVWPEIIGFQVDDDDRVLDWDSGSDGWSQLGWTAGLIDRLIEVLAPARLAPFQLQIDTSSLFIEHDDEHSKLGLGSSSAIAVGLFRVLAGFFGMRALRPEALLSTLLPVYQAAQQGQGSGIDLATSIHGGLIEFSNQQGETRVRSRDWPDGLLVDFAWTGRPASTPKLLLCYRQWQQDRPDQAERWHQTASSLLNDGAAALSSGDTDKLVGVLGEYGRGMSTIGGWMGVDLTSDVHLRIMHQAERMGLAAKPSGAGVGDLALIAGTCAEAMAAMRDWLASENILRVEMHPASAGASLDG